jgi:hypothetical protein
MLKNKEPKCWVLVRAILVYLAFMIDTTAVLDRVSFSLTTRNLGLRE